MANIVTPCGLLLVLTTGNFATLAANPLTHPLSPLAQADLPCAALTTGNFAILVANPLTHPSSPLAQADLPCAALTTDH